MTLLASRLLLLVLLVCDWAGDPHQGHSPLSRSLSSQEFTCHSLTHLSYLNSPVSVDDLFAVSSADSNAPVVTRPHVLPPEAVPSPSGADLVYAFMTLRR